MPCTCLLILALSGGLALGAPQGKGAGKLVRVKEHAQAGRVVLARLVDFDGDGRAELLVATADGRVTRLASDPAEWLRPAGEVVLSDPAHALLDFAALEPNRAGVQMLWATPRGTFLWGLDEQGLLAGEPRQLSSRARMPYRSGVPLLADLAQDVNHDGRPDLVLPVIGACELWLNEGADPGKLSLRRTARVAVDISSGVDSDVRLLSDELSSSISVPNLTTQDVNGDGRPDLLVAEGSRRSFFLQDAEGGFPASPDVVLDMDIFRDTAAGDRSLRPGQTLSLGETASYQSRDLNGDKLPDHVLAHGRKAWIFLGTERGPQFTEPLAILKTSEDITALTLARIDDDELPDLLLFKVQVPTIATLLRGLFGEWDVEIGAVGYRNLAGTGFETTPSKRADLVVRLPSIVRMLKNPADLLARFDELESRFRVVVRGDLDGDGNDDLGLVTSDGRRLELWIGSRGAGERGLDADRALREIFFESSEKVWDLDRILLWIGGVADRQVALETGGRPASAAFDLRDEKGLRLETLAAGDLDGDGRAELVLGYRPTGGGEGARFDVVRLEE